MEIISVTNACLLNFTIYPFEVERLNSVDYVVYTSPTLMLAILFKCESASPLVSLVHASHTCDWQLAFFF